MMSCTYHVRMSNVMFNFSVFSSIYTIFINSMTQKTAYDVDDLIASDHTQHCMSCEILWYEPIHLT